MSAVVCAATERRSKLRAHELPRGIEAISRALEAPRNTPLFPDIRGYPAVSKPTLDPPSGSLVTVRQNVATGAA